MERACQTLTKADIVQINRRMIAEFGGLPFVEPDNMVNPGSLEHVLVEIQDSIFGYERFPGIVEKAAALEWRINTGHVFNDANKRTATEACRLFWN